VLYLIRKIFKLSLIILGIFIILIFLGKVRNNFQSETNNFNTLPENGKEAVTPGDYFFTLTHGGIDRKYAVHVPINYNKIDSVPVLIVLHGGGGNMEESIKFFNLNPKADKEGFLAVYPEGYGKNLAGKYLGTWNAGKCCAPSMDENIDDVGFIDKVIEKITKDFHIDKNRIYSVGFSNGAQMSYRLACELSDKIAAVALGGSVGTFEGCAPKRPVPVYMFQGTADPCTPYEGGTKCGGCMGEFFNAIGIPTPINIYQCDSVDAFTDKVLAMNKCQENSSVTYSQGSTTCVTYDTCANGSEVTSCKILGGGHVWPGNKTYTIDICNTHPSGYVCSAWKKAVGPLIPDFNVTDQIWNFFKKYQL